jgi:pre-60S factor REI1
MSSTLTSTTAPGKEFLSRTELAEHYKSDWHKYNLKRREAGLALLEETDFQARWEAALALRKEKERKAHNGTDHIKASKKKNKKSQKQERTSTDEPIAPKAPREAPIEAPKEALTEKVVKVNTPQNENGYTFQVFVADDDAKTAPEINPKQSLFDSHISDSLKENLEYMQNEHGFFVPDQGKSQPSTYSRNSASNSTVCHLISHGLFCAIL